MPACTLFLALGTRGGSWRALWFASWLVGSLGACSTGAYAQQPAAEAPGASHYHLAGGWKAGGEGGWDDLTLDSQSHRLYVARTDRVQIFNPETGTLVREIPGLEGGHGVALAPDLDRGFATSGGGGTVLMFSLSSLRPDGAPVAIGKEPAAVVYEPATRHVLVFDRKGGEAGVIDGATLTPVGTVPLGGQPKAAVSDGRGTVFATLEDKGEIVAIDARKNSVARRWPLAPGSGPAGFALDPIRHRLFVGCRDGRMIVLDAQSGRHLAELALGKGVDACAVDPGTGLAFACCEDGTLTVVREDSAGPGGFRVTETIPTQRGARTMAVDPGTHAIYLAVSNLEDASAATPGDEPLHVRVVPWTFALLKFAR